MHLQLKRESTRELHTAATIQSERDRASILSAIVLIVILASPCSIPRVAEVLLLRSLEFGRISGEGKMPQKEVL